MPTGQDELPENPVPPPRQTLVAAAIGGFLGAVVGAGATMMMMSGDSDHDGDRKTGWYLPGGMISPVAAVESRHV